MCFRSRIKPREWSSQASNCHIFSTAVLDRTCFQFQCAFGSLASVCIPSFLALQLSKESVMRQRSLTSSVYVRHTDSQTQWSGVIPSSLRYLLLAQITSIAPAPEIAVCLQDVDHYSMVPIGRQWCENWWHVSLLPIASKSWCL